MTLRLSTSSPSLTSIGRSSSSQQLKEGRDKRDNNNNNNQVVSKPSISLVTTTNERCSMKQVMKVVVNDSRTILLPIKSSLNKKSLQELDMKEEKKVENATTTTTTPASTPQTVKKSVSFHQIEIREHEVTISDHPGVSTGIAVGMGWKSIDIDPTPISDYETNRPPRRFKSALMIPAEVREARLRNEWDISQQEINQHLRQITKIKNSRYHATKNHKVYIEDTRRNSAPASTTAAASAEPLKKSRSFLALTKLIRGDVDAEAQRLMELSIIAEQKREEQRRLHLLEKEREMLQQQQAQEQPTIIDSPIKNNKNNNNDDSFNNSTATIEDDLDGALEF